MVGGLVLAVLGMTGLFGYLKALFTPRVVAATLILIAYHDTHDYEFNNNYFPRE